MDNRPIGVFDSGLGGLTAVRELKKVLPQEDIVYFGDTGRVPYGGRSPKIILEYAKQDIAFLLSKNVKCIMAACGTVSSILPQELAQSLPVPFLGVVESTAKAATTATKNGHIGVIGTAATIRSQSYAQQLRKQLENCVISARACPMFVPLVENGYLGKGNPITTAIAKEYLQEMARQDIDTLILGCTHYPLIADIIGDVVGTKVTLIDPGRETAHRLREILQQKGLLGQNTGNTEYFVSDSVDSFRTISNRFLGEYAGGSVHQIDIDQFQLSFPCPQ